MKLAVESGEARLVIEDDGRAAKPVVPGNGLSGMRERLRMLGGHLEIESRARAGHAAGCWSADAAASRAAQRACCVWSDPHCARLKTCVFALKSPAVAACAALPERLR